MIQQLQSLDGTEALYVTKCFLSIAVPAFLWGSNIGAMFSSAIAFLVVYDSTASHIPPQWIGLTCISTVAGIVSLGLLHLAPHQVSDDDAYYMWFLGTAIQKVWGMLLCYVLYQDFNKQPWISSSLDKVEKETPELEIHVQIIAGRDLVAKDKNIFGRKTSSDPYVRVYHGSDHIGKTNIIYKTLNPVWENQVFNLHVQPEAIELSQFVECHIFDHDHLSEDDPMGTVYIPLPTQQHNVKVTKWYKVETGQGQDYCKNPTGDLYVTVEVRSKLRQLPTTTTTSVSSTSQRHLISSGVDVRSGSSSSNKTNAYYYPDRRVGLNRQTPLHTTTHHVEETRSAFF